MDEQDKKDMQKEEPANPAGAAADEIAQCQKQRDEYLAGWQRAKADFINYKKDEARRVEEIARYATEEIIRELITVMDNFDLALLAMGKGKEASGSGGGEAGVPTPQAVGMEKGVYMIRSQMEDILKRYGLSRLGAAKGEKFDPAVHEAVTEVESDAPPGTVIEEIEPGYKLYDRIVRPARVKVSR